MKIVITGATGYIGTEVLRLAIANPSITHIFTLTRKPLPQPLLDVPKVTSIIHKDFSKYPETLMSNLTGVEACIWMIGVPRPKEDPRPIDVGYTQAFSRACATYLAPRIPSGAPFRFIYVSGGLSVQEQNASLWFNAAGRLSRGAAETAILEFAGKSEGRFEGIVVRPGLVMRRLWMAVSPDWSIPLEWLAAALLEIGKACGGSRRVENRELVEVGKKAVDARGAK